jgi:hypothetical protein
MEWVSYMISMILSFQIGFGRSWAMKRETDSQVDILGVQNTPKALIDESLN